MVLELALIGITVAISAAAVAIYWTKILRWAQGNLLPWIDRNIPALSDDVRTALVNIDKVVTPMRAAAKAAWQRLRQTLLRQIAEFEHHSKNAWLLRITSWVRVKLDALAPEPVVKQIVTEQIVSYEELPSEVRQELLRQGETTQQIDITRAQDRKLELAMST